MTRTSFTTSGAHRWTLLRTLSNIILSYSCIVILFPILPVISEPVIFEQFGTLVGSTSYMHVHVPLYIGSIAAQYNKYEEYLIKEFANSETVRNWLYEGLLFSKNISVKAKTSSIPENIRGEFNTLTTAINANAKVFHEIGQLHLRDLYDIKATVNALKQMMPPQEDNPYSPLRQGRSNPDGTPGLSRNAYVANGFGGDGEECEKYGCVVVPIPSKFDEVKDSDFDDHPFTSTTTSPKPTRSFKHVQLRPGETYKALNKDVQEPWDGFGTIHNLRGRSVTDDSLTPLSRKKRVFGAIALPIAMAATAMGLFNRVQIMALQEELFEVKSNTQRLFTIAQNLTKSVIAIEKNVQDIRTTLIAMVASNPAIADARMTRIENQLRHRIMRTTHAVQSAIHGRLAIDYLDANRVSGVFEEIKKKAVQLGCDLLIEYHTDLFQVEASLLFDGKDAHILVHVPMAPKDGQLRLFRLHPFPLPLLEDSYLIPDVKNDVLAISSTTSKLNIQLAAVELLSCHRRNQIFMCDNFGVMSKRFNTTCLGALYMSMFEQAQKLCKFRVAPAEELAYQIKKGEFIIYVNQPATINIMCRNNTHSEKHLKKGSQTITISKGCHGELQYHKLVSDYSDSLNSDITTYTWDWEPTNFMQNFGEDIPKAIAKLADMQIHAPDLAQIQYIASVPDTFGSSSSLGYLLTAICAGGLIIAVCVCGGLIYTRCPCCRTKPATQRRGRGRPPKRQPSRGCGLLCCSCCKRDEKEPPAVKWARGSNTDDITFEARRGTISSPARVTSGDERTLRSDLLKANKALEKRLSTIERQQRLSRVYEDEDV